MPNQKVEEKQAASRSSDSGSAPTGGLSISMAIILAGAIVAGAIVMTSSGGGSEQMAAVADSNVVHETNTTIPLPNSDDHILGDPNAPIIIVEYSDTECPFCSRFHETMNRIVDTYGKNGDVAWIYRHFPLDQLHSLARREAEATECAADQGGNDGFWSFTNRLFKVTPGNDGLDPKQLPIIAGEVGLDVDEFNECLESGRFAEKVDNQAKDAFAAGANGTPFNIVIVGDQMIPLAGALPYESMASTIEEILAAQ
ncbi:disulfide bond formation protein DsbA [Candidatus Wolfebacteria bacterium]|nr:MAG: disulfide bond formation protein DsbA [Candidatus Wolfebacteria bacterium]